MIRLLAAPVKRKPGGQRRAAFLEADQSGKAGDRGDWVRRHPELADDLRRFFERHDRLARLAAPLRATDQVSTIDQHPDRIRRRPLSVLGTHGTGSPSIALD
jgi:hypothetical protein